MSKYTHMQIACSWDLWREYFDVDAVMDQEEFDALTLDARMLMLIAAFGANGSCDVEGRGHE